MSLMGSALLTVTFTGADASETTQTIDVAGVKAGDIILQVIQTVNGVAISPSIFTAGIEVDGEISQVSQNLSGDSYQAVLARFLS
jgi:hypothetical protein